MNRYEEVRIFVATVETGSFTSAADRLGLAKSAVSRRISELEARLGVQLLTRTTRALTLTEEGRLFYDRASRLLRDWEDTEAAIRDQSGELQGKLRIAAPLSFGVTYLSDVVLKFLKRHPEIEFDIDFSDRQLDLIAEGIDLALRIGTLEDSSLIARRITSIEMIAAASPAYLAQNGRPETPEALLQHKELSYSHRPQKDWSYTAPDGTSDSIRLAPRLTATNGEFLRDAALAGEGIVILPAFILCNEIKSGELECLLPDYKWPKLGLYAVYPATRFLSARVRAFIDMMIAAYQDNPPWAT